MAKKRANGEGSIRKRSDGRWEGRYTAGRDPATGKPIYKNVLGKTQAEVKTKLRQAIEKSAQLDMSRTGSYTVETWLKLWYEIYAEPRLRETTNDDTAEFSDSVGVNYLQCAFETTEINICFQFHNSCTS